MKRTTVVAEEETLARLRALARDRGVSMSEVVREALAEKATEYRPKPRSLGAGQSSRSQTAREKATKRLPPRSWH